MTYGVRIIYVCITSGFLSLALVIVILLDLLLFGSGPTPGMESTERLKNHIFFLLRDLIPYASRALLCKLALQFIEPDGLAGRISKHAEASGEAAPL